MVLYIDVVNEIDAFCRKQSNNLIYAPDGGSWVYCQSQQEVWEHSG